MLFDFHNYLSKQSRKELNNFIQACYDKVTRIVSSYYSNSFSRGENPSNLYSKDNSVDTMQSSAKEKVEGYVIQKAIVKRFELIEDGKQTLRINSKDGEGAN